MGERKVVTKYIPPDFDPSLVPRGKKLSSKDGTVPVRMMLPFSIQCTTCHTFLYRGRKFNSKKEPMGGPAGVYLGITRWRFYIKCTQCSRTLTFCTDPQNADYEMESGGTRNYEYTAERKNLEQDAVTETEKAIKEDPLKALETRVLDSQREMADLDNLEEIRAMNARHVQILKGRPGGDGNANDDYFGADTEAVLRIRHGQETTDNDNSMTPDGLLTEQDEALIASIQFGKKKAALTNSIRRLDEEDERRAEEQRKLEATRLMERRQQELEKQQQQLSKPKIIPVIKAKRKRTTTTEAVVEEDQEGSPNSKKANVAATTTINETKVEQPSGNLASLLVGYSSDSDSS